MGQWGSPTMGRWDFSRGTILSQLADFLITQVISSPNTLFKLLVRLCSFAPPPPPPNSAQGGVYIKSSTEMYFLSLPLILSTV
jgi:hypothetical protein